MRRVIKKRRRRALKKLKDALNGKHIPAHDQKIVLHAALYGFRQ
jgi:hypothetical protein